MTIRFLDPRGSQNEAEEVIVEYVGGPLAGRREVLLKAPDAIRAPGSGRTYRRSVKCADDGALRYVWQADAVAIETG